ncbi:MAG: hypothetical protein KAH95_16480 [Spirochaetales bacterium]|nr:hypothetical protein [Spirochaetales bacterium]
MRRYFLSFLLIILCTGFIYSQEEINTASNESKNYIFQFSIGSAYSFYFPTIESTVDTMDSESLFRFPISMDFLYGKKMSEKSAWVVSLTTGIDIFSSSPDSFQVYTIMLSGGFQYMPFQKGLTLGIDAGLSMLIPNTKLDYIGSVEFGPGISLNIGYLFDTLKLSKKNLIPGLGLKLIHSDMFRGPVDQICGYINLGIR